MLMSLSTGGRVSDFSQLLDTNAWNLESLIRESVSQMVRTISED